VTPLFIACDFDGTITRRDTLHLIVDTYGERAVWDEIEPALRRGEISLEQAMQTEFATVRATPAQVREVVLAEAGIREGFVEFIAWARGSGHRVVILSSGFRSVIDTVLGSLGLADLEVHSHEAHFSPEGTDVEWTARGERCTMCERNCKRHDLARLRRDTERVVYVGDGISDRCVSGAADVVFARDGLAEYLTETGTRFFPFDDFSDIRTHLDAMARAA
jgi:2-hydroxy-3-keto-5-methylthiopentenyl-1-phosphate phosphatase